MKIGVIGNNFGLKVHKPAFESLGCEVLMLGRDYADRLDEVDAVSIAVPPKWHCPVLLRVFEAGKHTLCEKPVGTSSFDAVTPPRDLVAAVGFQFRYHLPAGNHLNAVISITGKSQNVIRDYGCHVFDYMRYCCGPVKIEHVYDYDNWASIWTDKGRVVLSARGNLGHWVYIDGREFNLHGDRVEMWKPLAKDFLDAIEGKPNILPTFEDAVEAWKLIDACKEFNG